MGQSRDASSPRTSTRQSFVSLISQPHSPHRGAIGTNEALDRKSTRLNSSHDQISYAVFCLKKKKKYNRNLILETYARSEYNLTTGGYTSLFWGGVVD